MPAINCTVHVLITGRWALATMGHPNTLRQQQQFHSNEWAGAASTQAYVEEEGEEEDGDDIDEY